MSRNQNFIDFWESNFDNVKERNLAFMRIINIALVRYKWKNVPYGCDMRYFEKTLIEDGVATIFYEPTLERYLSLGLAFQGALDVYGIPKKYNAISNNGQPFMELTPETAPLCWENATHMPLLPIIREHAYKIYKLERLAENNANQQKYATIVKTPQSLQMTFRNLMMKLDGNQPMVFGDKDLDLSSIQTLDLNIPFVADKIISVRNFQYNDAMTDIGVPDYSNDKRERLTSLETYGSMGSVELVQKSGLDQRKLFCEQFNAIYNKELDVELNTDIPVSPAQEVNNNGSLYDDVEDIY